MTVPIAAAEDTFAVISAYHPPADFAVRAEGLLGQVQRVIVVDDGSGSGLVFGDARVELIDLSVNGGIARALNVGVRRARELGATYVLILDQDSIVPVGYVNAMRAALQARQAAGLRVAAVVPAIVEGDVITTMGGDRPLDPIQSGQVLPLSAMAQIGEFDERLVIDAVDSEYTLRARRKGHDLYVVPGVELGHSLGELEPLLIRGKHRRVLGRPRYWRYHAPFRTYYMLRNGLALWRLHLRGNLAWLLRRTAYHLAVDIVYTSLASPDRRAQFVAIRRALRDTARRRLGRIPQPTLDAIDRRRRRDRGDEQR